MTPHVSPLMRVERALRIDVPRECDRICDWLRGFLRTFKRRGFVIGVSGGVDSAVCAALCVEAVGASRVCALHFPDQDSAAESTVRAHALAEALGLRLHVEDISDVLASIGCYAERDAAIRNLVPGYGPGWAYKTVLSGGLDQGINYVNLVVRDACGAVCVHRLPANRFRHLYAATNHKQRIRKTLEYFHADRLLHAVVGTANRLEFELGFFVKNGDGAADVKPIAHLLKGQVFQIARALGLPADITTAEPTTDIHPLPQSQVEAFFSSPLEHLDYILWALERGQPARTIADDLGLPPERVTQIARDIEAKRRTAAYLSASSAIVGGPPCPGA